MKRLLARLNSFCTGAMEAAVGMCVSHGHYEVTVEHFVLQCLRAPTADFSLILRRFGLDSAALELELVREVDNRRTGNSAKPVFSPRLIDLLQDALLVAMVDLAEERIRSGTVARALAASPVAYGSGGWADLFGAVSSDALSRAFGEITASSDETPGLSAPEAASTSGDSFTARFCTDLTAKADGGGIDQVFGRDREVRQIVDILCRRRKNNPICVGEPGVGKTAVVEGLALRIAAGDVPEALRNVRLLELDMGLLEAGTGVKGEFERRLRGVIEEVKASERPVVLFIDEAHTLVGGGGHADAANLMKPALARGELRTIAATTWSEYKKYFEKDAALARRFQPVKIEQPSVEDTVLILRGIKSAYEKAHGVGVRDDAIKAIARYADRYIAGRMLPDKAIDLLDTSCARVKVSLTARPSALEDLQRRDQALRREREALERDRAHGRAVDEARLAAIGATLEETATETMAVRDRWEIQRAGAATVLALRSDLVRATPGEVGQDTMQELLEATEALREASGARPMVHVEVDPDIVARVVSDWTGIPVGRFLRDEAEVIAGLEERMSERIKGQIPAIAAISGGLKAAKAGLRDPNRPLGVFLLVGPSGTGKTETGRVLAELLFGSTNRLITLNMTEFQESHSVSRLIGSPPGYVGYGEGGMLTEAVRQRPYSVVLLDEAEKAHLDVMETFYQVFDKGCMCDGEGKEISFRNTVILLTSNLGSEAISLEGTGASADRLAEIVRPVLADHFKPALLARMTVVPYLPLDSEAIAVIIDLKLSQVTERLRAANGVGLVLSPGVAGAIAERCAGRDTGARAIDHVLEGSVLRRLAQEILMRMGQGAMPSSALVDVGPNGGFEFTFTP